MTESIELKQVNWTREGTQVLKNINWTAKDGEHWAILGLNGSGKTTLLNMLTGYLWPTSGEITVLGRKYGEVDLREHRRLIGWVSSSLEGKLYIRELAQDVVVSGKYASFGLYEKPLDSDYERAAELLEQFGCSHLLGRSYQTCSQGEKQKLLICRALMASPKLLILDEACNGLDFISRENLLESITLLGKQPQAPSMLFVTHHTEEIVPLFAKTLLLRRGEIAYAGLTSELLTDRILSDFFETSVQVSWNQQRAFVTKK